MPSLYDILPRGASDRLFTASQGCNGKNVDFALALASELGAVIADLAARVEALEQHATTPEARDE